MFRKILALNMALIGLGIFAGCVVDGPENQAEAPIKTQTVTAVDLDATHDRARGLFYDLKVDDSIDFNGNDSEDWRYIIVPETGVLSLSLRLDTPNGVNGMVKIQDAQGRPLRSLTIDPEKNFYEITDLPVTEGIYHFQIMVTKGASSYTLGADFKAQAEPVLVADNTTQPDPAPEIKKTTEPKDNDGKKREGDRKKKSKPEPTTGGDDKKKPTPPPPEPAPAEPAKKVTGFISLITPKPDGSAEVTIRDVGKNKGVEAGAVGSVEGTKMKLKTTQCFATSCRAVIPESADPKSIKQGANVTFSVKGANVTFSVK